MANTLRLPLESRRSRFGNPQVSQPIGGLVLKADACISAKPCLRAASANGGTLNTNILPKPSAFFQAQVDRMSRAFDSAFTQFCDQTVGQQK